LKGAAILFLALFAPLAALAQSSDEDRGFLVEFLETNLSDAGRQVRITGFRGALSSKAELDSLTIADDLGIWFTMTDAVLNWDRGALLRGQLNINELSAAGIEVSRRPVGEIDGQKFVGGGSEFSLPELPASLTIGTLSLARLKLGEALFGEAAEVSLSGSAALAGGAGQADLRVNRIDGQTGALELVGAYSNQTRQLDLSLQLTEAADGIVAELLNLPARPSVAFSIVGSAPIDEFGATILLQTAGQDRLRGQVQLLATGQGATGFSADIHGDLTPLFAPQYREFFGSDVGLKLIGQRRADGTVEIETLDLAARELALSARLNGTASPDLRRFELTAIGTVPLGLANRYIRPQSVSGLASFDLALNGPLTLSSLSGTLRTDAARISLPERALALNDVTATAVLANGQGSINGWAGVSKGGSGSISGTIGLAAPFPGDLEVTLDNVAVSQSRVFETTATGAVRVKGPVMGGALIEGALTLGKVEIQLTSPGNGANAAIPKIEHLNAPAVVQKTREHAGLLEHPSGPVRSYPISLLVRAPDRIFVRGLGLDAELGGKLRLRGTTEALAPEGQFDLIRGRMDILGRRLTLSEGFARLEGNFDPYLRLVANASTSDITVQIVIEGRASALEFSFHSTPQLPEEEVLSLFIFGRDITDLSPLQAARLAGAFATLLGNGGGAVNRLRENFGLDDLDITTADDGTIGARVGAYLSENIYSDITLDEDGKTEINLNLSITPSVTARGRLNSEGDTSLGVFIEKDY